MQDNKEKFRCLCPQLDGGFRLEKQAGQIQNAFLQLFWFPIGRMLVEFLRTVEVELPDNAVPLIFRPEGRFHRSFAGVNIYMGQLRQAKKYPCIEVCYNEENGLGNEAKSTQNISFLLDIYTHNTDTDMMKVFEEHYYMQVRLVTALYAFQQWFQMEDIRPYQLGLNLKIGSVVSDVDAMEIPTLGSRIALELEIKKVLPPRQSVYKKYD